MEMTIDTPDLADIVIEGAKRFDPQGKSLLQMLNARKLATIRTIAEIKPIEGADKIVIAVVDGWQCVVKKDQFIAGDLCCYIEIDSWVPHELAPFLTAAGHHPKEFEGIPGERLKTKKLRGVISQGLVLSLQDIHNQLSENEFRFLVEGDDITDILGIKKWERPISANMRGTTRGYFPSFIRKTDQERIQNVFKYLTPEQKAEEYEVTLKMDGSSCTFYYKDGQVGVCSRNLDLKTDDENADNSFVKMFRQLDICAKLVDFGKNIAIQGELYGSGINGNWEGLADHQFRVFDIWDIDTQSYMPANKVWDICIQLGLLHVPLRETTTLEKFTSVDDFLQYADAPSLHNKTAEGFVFKSLTNPNFSFKVINNKFLLNGGE